ncbi:MAG: c-type cytochrome [Bacteroidota bacterium]|nr:c-type cytochrome [Bacteroidota bacterium]
MRKTIMTLSLILSLVILSIMSCKTREPKQTENAIISNDSLIKRGEYLVAIMGCDDCHSPKSMTAQGPTVDNDHRLSGYPATRPIAKVSPEAQKNGWILFGGDLTSSVGPWGVSFSANITPDPKTGIGNWTEEQFKRAITQGKSKGLEKSRDLLPPMPWRDFRNLHDEDIKAIYTYLLSLKPVENIVPEPKQLSEL